MGAVLSGIESTEAALTRAYRPSTYAPRVSERRAAYQPRSIVQSTFMSAASESRTEQYLVTASSTARSA